jgi:tRNA threonylcarbamoyladenosine biosynthesis protein TsaB
MPSTLPSDAHHPILLAIDAATTVCSVALGRSDEVVLLSDVVGTAHSERLLPMVREVLAGQGLDLGDCEAIAFGAGPGSFTGLRIACGVAQGLAYGLDLPVVPVGNLTALALAAWDGGDRERIAVAIDARMNEVYWAVYDVASAEAVVEVVPPSVCPAGLLLDALGGSRPTVLAGNALTAFPESLSAFGGDRRPGAAADAGAIVRLAAAAWRRGEAVEAAQAQPVYVRNRVAQTVAERTAGRRDWVQEASTP